MNESVLRIAVRAEKRVRVVERERDIRRGVLIQAFPAPANMFTVPSGEVVDVNSEANVPGHIVFTRILSLFSLAII
jgi:hypothetical protein